MTSNRNINSDRAATNAVLDATPEVQLNYGNARPNWLGHKGGSAIVDACVINGATLDEMAQLSGRGSSAVRSHLNHLTKEHGLLVEKSNQNWRFLHQDEADEFGDELEAEVAVVAEVVAPPHGAGPVPIIAAAHPQGATYGLVLRDREGRSTAHVFGNHGDALDALAPDGTDLVFLVIGSGNDAVSAVVNAVAEVLNRWVEGLNQQLDVDWMAVRPRGAWQQQFPAGQYYVYEYRRSDGATFYVGKGTGPRSQKHIQDAKDANRRCMRLSRKLQLIHDELAGGNEVPVRLIASFTGQHAELCSFAVERCLIVSVYGIFELSNETSGNTGFQDFYWLSQPKAALGSQDKQMVWRDIARSALQNRRNFPTSTARLAWLDLENHLGGVGNLFAPFVDGGILAFLGVGQRGQDICGEWQGIQLPVRIQMKFSHKAKRVRFNLRPRVPQFGGAPIPDEAGRFKDFICQRFAGRYPDDTQIVKIRDALDCFFKPFAFDAEGRRDPSFDFSDPDLQLALELNWERQVNELSLSQALTLIVQFLQGPAGEG